MTWRWVICSSLCIAPLAAATVYGRVELRDSRDVTVQKHRDYSGVVVSLKPPPGVPAPEITPEHATMLQKDKTFSPHVLAIAVGSTVNFPNLDPIFHNAFSSYNGQIFDVGLYPPGTTRSVHFTREGVVRVFCNIHSSMSAVIVVMATPYFAITKRDGTFSIPNVPGGEYDLTAFHERATEATLRKLNRRVSVEGEMVTLPTLDVSEAGFLTIPHKNKYGRDYPPDSADPMYPARR
jgi:plastocyanin